MLDLTVPAAKETALLELSKKRESFPELAPYLWHSFGTMAALLQEIVSIYPMLQPPSLTAHASNRVCNALALLQCVASHPETRSLFLQGGCQPGCPACQQGACRGTGPRRPGLVQLSACMVPGCLPNSVALGRQAAVYRPAALPRLLCCSLSPLQRTSRCSSTPSSTPSARRGHLSTCGSPAWASLERSSRCVLGQHACGCAGPSS